MAAISAGTEEITQISETTTEETDLYNAFRTEVNKTRDKRILQIFVIAAIEFFGVQVSQIENIKSFSEVYELIEKATTKDVAPFIVHEITEFIESIEGLDPDATRALKEKARAAMIAITDKVNVKSKYPNLDFVLTLGAMVLFMGENDYDKFHEHIAKKILKDSQLEIERCMIIHELIQGKHLNLKSNHSNDTRETTPTVGAEMKATGEGSEVPTDPFNENIEKISKWLDQSNCSKNRGFIVKYCKMNGINPPKKGINFICM